MKVKYKKIAGLISASALLAGAAQADDLKIKVGAHAFFDYENVEINSMTPVDGTDLRLFRVDVGGSYGDYVFKSNFDLHGDDVKVQDLFIEFKGDTKIRIGNFKIMNGLEQESSLYSTPFAEAGSVKRVNGLGRKLGIAAYRSFDNVHLSGGIFSANVNDNGDKDEWAVSGRVATELHPNGEDSLLHLGASARYRENADTGTYSYAHKPFANSSPSTVKVSGLADSDLFIGLEGAYLKDGLSLQSEYAITKADCIVCSGDAEFQSYYVDASYTWGGHRVMKKGLFSRNKIDKPASEGGMGSFAVSVRYDVADLNDDVIMGGRQESWVLGGTWFRDKYVRVLANYTHAEISDSPSYGDTDADTFVIRLQAELY